MNIYALEGHEVTCYTLSAGYKFDQEQAEKYLKIGNKYTVEYTEVDSSFTEVYLKEFPNVMFNSVFFEDAVEQSEEEDKQHPDYLRYN